MHGVALARSLPRETAGIVMSLCDGTYSPTNVDSLNDNSASDNNLFMENRKRKCDRYPVSMFTSAFIENSKLLRLVLAHCKRNHCELLPSMRRTHLELTLEEWNTARRNGDGEMEMIRSDEAMTVCVQLHSNMSLSIHCLGKACAVKSHFGTFGFGFCMYHLFPSTPVGVDRYLC